MVISCVAYGCNNEQDKRKISFHTFPFKRPDILKLWIQALHRDNWVPSKTSRLCGEHFLPTDYVIRPGLRANLLKPNAVPSVFSFPEHLSSEITVPHRKILKQIIPTESMKTENELIDTDLPSVFPFPEHLSSKITVPYGEILKQIIPAESIKTEIELTDTVSLSTSASIASIAMTFDKETQTVPNNTIALLRRKVKTLRQKANRRDTKIRKMKDIISAIKKKKSGHSRGSLDAVNQIL